MAAGSLPKPGTNLGPCKEECDHVDCEETREMAAKVCRFCGKKIGYGTPFYNDREAGEDELAHAVCVEVEADRKRKAKKVR